MRKKIALLLVLPFALASCLPQTQSESNLLKHHQHQWQAHKIKDYRYTLKIDCFCVPEVRQPVVIEVHNGQTVSITSAESGVRVDSEFFESVNTIAKLFDLVRAAIEHKAAIVSVSYNSPFGYPEKIYIDRIKEAVDEEISYTVTDFTVLTTPL